MSGIFAKSRWSSSPGWLLGVALVGACLSLPEANASAAFTSAGGTYPVVGKLPADQSLPFVALGQTGGLVVWEDNSPDYGTGIVARRLNRNGSGYFQSFPVNTLASGDNSLPQATLLSSGNALITWNHSDAGKKSIYVRVLKTGDASPSFASSEVNLSVEGVQNSLTPASTALVDGSALVTWTGQGADGSWLGVYAQRLQADGSPTGKPFLVNQSTDGNHRSPSVASLKDGRFVIAWVAENQRIERSADVLARVFTLDGSIASDEVRLNYGTNICSSPSLTQLSNGGFVAVWSERESGNSGAGWDVYSRTFDGSGVSATPSVKISTSVSENQLGARLAQAGDTLLVSWTSIGANPNFSSIRARYLSVDGQPLDNELVLSNDQSLRVSTPAVASDGGNSFVAVWSSFSSVETGFDLTAQRFTRIGALAPAVCSVENQNGQWVLSWTTESNGSYQVQTSTDLTTWSNFGAPRTAASGSDSVAATAALNGTFYRVLRLQ
jgi:hypothetical protein